MTETKMKDEADIEALLNKAMKKVREAEDVTGEETYAEGVEAALMWVLGHDNEGPL